MAVQLLHTGLTVSDLDRALRFWRDGLGMEVVMQQEKQGGYLEEIVVEPGAHVRMAHLAFPGGGHVIELFQYLEPRRHTVQTRPADVGFKHVCVTCDDIDALCNRMVAHGGRPFTPPIVVDTGANAGGRCLYMHDPDGHVLELFQPPRPPGQA